MQIEIVEDVLSDGSIAHNVVLTTVNYNDDKTIITLAATNPWHAANIREVLSNCSWISIEN